MGRTLGEVFFFVKVRPESTIRPQLCGGLAAAMSPAHKQLLGSDLRTVQDCCCPVHCWVLEALRRQPVAPPQAPAPKNRQGWGQVVIMVAIGWLLLENQFILAPAMFFKNTFVLGQKSRGGKVLILALGHSTNS